MVSANTSRFETAFTDSVDAREGTTTGISAADRAVTVLRLVDPKSTHRDFVRPGHMFPLRSREGGVLVRSGQTEASVDLARIAGLYPAGVICEIMNEDGTMARMPQLEEFSTQFGLRVITIAELIQYRLRTETLIQEVERAELATEFGRFTAVVFRNRLDQKTHLALVKGDVAGGEPVYVRVHTQSIPGDVFLSERNPTGSYLRACLRLIAEQGRGVVVYLRLDDDGERLVGEIRAGREKSTAPGYSYSDDLYRAEDPKHYGVGAQILNQLGLKRIVLLTGHHRKFSALHGYGLDIVGEVDVHTLVPQA
jgi:3,4-dihydroxy 2-butanone 4-phosphate synthase/GTP cyclohydrolase II